MQATLGEVEGAAGPMHEGFTRNQILKHEASLFHQRAVRCCTVEPKPLFHSRLDPGLVFGMTATSIYLQSNVNLAHCIIALIHTFDCATDLADIRIDA